MVLEACSNAAPFLFNVFRTAFVALPRLSALTMDVGLTFAEAMLLPQVQIKVAAPHMGHAKSWGFEVA